jgi:hypothetical protein
VSKILSAVHAVPPYIPDTNMKFIKKNIFCLACQEWIKLTKSSIKLSDS